MSETLVKVENVSKKFCRDLKRSLWYGMQDLSRELFGLQHGGNGELRRDEFWAIKDISFELKRGECLSLIGRNGAGKTTLLKMLNGLIKPDMGRIEIRGRIGALIALGAGFNPILSGRENIYINASILGIERSEINRKLDDIVSFAELQEFIDSPVKNYSSGMHARLGFSIAANFQPDILLIDEALAVGDMEFTIKCLNRIADLQQQGAAIIFISHNELQIRRVAQRCILLHKGQGTHYNSLDQAFLDYGNFRLINDPPSMNISKTVYSDSLNRISVNVRTSSGDYRIATGDKIVLEIDCESSRNNSNCELELRFWDSFDQLMTTLRSKSFGADMSIPKDKSRIQVHISSLNLPPGRYRLAGGVTQGGKALAWSTHLAEFSVSQPKKGWIGQGPTMLQGRIDAPQKIN